MTTSLPFRDLVLFSYNVGYPNLSFEHFATVVPKNVQDTPESEPEVYVTQWTGNLALVN